MSFRDMRGFAAHRFAHAGHYGSGMRGLVAPIGVSLL
jgi:hypothetical protein